MSPKKTLRPWKELQGKRQTRSDMEETQCRVLTRGYNIDPRYCCPSPFLRFCPSFIDDGCVEGCWMHGIQELLMLLRVRMWSHLNSFLEELIFNTFVLFLQAFHDGDSAWLQTYGNLLPRSRVIDSPDKSINQNNNEAELPPAHMLLAFQVIATPAKQCPANHCSL